MLLDPTSYIDASIAQAPYSSAKALEAFYLPPPKAEPVKFGEWVGAVDAGASVNCPILTCCPHGNGTHTECVAHALPGTLSIVDLVLRKPGALPSLMPGLLVTVKPQRMEEAAADMAVYTSAKAEDLAVTGAALAAALSEAQATLKLSSEQLKAALQGGALMVRTLPNGEEKQSATYSGKNPVFFTPLAVQHALETLGIRHLLVDLPSMDKENDEGLLLAHRAFWGLSPKSKEADAAAAAAVESLSSMTITELCYFSSESLKDGLYGVSLQVAPVGLDAAPSRPLLHPATVVAEGKIGRAHV